MISWSATMSSALIINCVLATWLFAHIGAITVSIDRSDVKSPPPTRSSMIANGWRPLTNGYKETIGTNVSPASNLERNAAPPHPVLSKLQEHMATSEKLKPQRKSKPSSYHDYNPPSILGSFSVFGHAATKARAEAPTHNHVHKHVGSETREYTFLIPPPKDVYRFEVDHHRKPVIRDGQSYLRQPPYNPHLVHPEPLRSPPYYVKGYTSTTNNPSQSSKNRPFNGYNVPHQLQPPRHEAKPFESMKLSNAKPYLQPPSAEATDFGKQKVRNQHDHRHYDRYEPVVSHQAGAAEYYPPAAHTHHYKPNYERDPAFLVHESHEVSYVTPSPGYSDYSFRPSLPYDSIYPPNVYSSPAPPSTTAIPRHQEAKESKRPGHHTKYDSTGHGEVISNTGVSTSTYYVSEPQDLTSPASGWSSSSKSKYTSDINEVLPRVNPPSKFSQEVPSNNQIPQKVVYENGYVRPQNQQYQSSVLPIDIRPQTPEYETPESISLKHFNEQQFLLQQQLVQRDRQRLAEQERQQQLEIERQEQEELKKRQEELQQLIRRQKEEEEARLAIEKAKNQSQELTRVVDEQMPYTIQLAQYEMPQVTTDIGIHVSEQSTIGEQPRIQPQIIQTEPSVPVTVSEQYHHQLQEDLQKQQQLEFEELLRNQQLPHQRNLQKQPLINQQQLQNEQLYNQQQLQNQQLHNQQQLQNEQLHNQQQLQNQQLQNQQLQNQQLQNQQLQNQQLQNQQLQNQQLQNQQLEYQQQLQNQQLEYQQVQEPQLQNEYQQEVRPYRPHKPSRDQTRRRKPTTPSYSVQSTEAPTLAPETSVPLTLLTEDIPIQTTATPETVTLPVSTQRSRPRRPGSGRRRRPTTTTEQPVVVPQGEEDFLKYGRPEGGYHHTESSRRRRPKPTQSTVDADSVTERRTNIRKRPGHRQRVNPGEPFEAEIVTEIVQSPTRETTEPAQRYTESQFANNQFSTGHNQYLDYSTSQRLQPEDQREYTTQPVQLDYLTEITRSKDEYSGVDDRGPHRNNNVVTSIPLEDLFTRPEGGYYDKGAIESATPGTTSATTEPSTTQSPQITSTTTRLSKIRPLRYGNTTRPRFSIKDYKSRMDYKNRLSQISTTEAPPGAPAQKQRFSNFKTPGNTDRDSSRYKYVPRTSYRTSTAAPAKDQDQVSEDTTSSTTEKSVKFVPKRRPVSNNVYRSRISATTTAPSRSQQTDGEGHSKYSTGRPENIYSSSIRRRPTMRSRVQIHKETSTASHSDRREEGATEMAAEETSFYSAVTTTSSVRATNEIDVDKTKLEPTSFPLRNSSEDKMEEQRKSSESESATERTNSTLESTVKSEVLETGVSVSSEKPQEKEEERKEEVTTKFTVSQEEEELLAKASQSVADLTSSASALYDKPGMFKAVSPESRVSASQIKVTSGDEPTLPIEAFFQELSKKSK